MYHRSAVIIFINKMTQFTADLEIPLDISAHELVLALNEIYKLGIDVSDTRKCFLKAKYPLALLKGGCSLEKFGIRNGSVIIYEV